MLYVKPKIGSVHAPLASDSHLHAGVAFSNYSPRAICSVSSTCGLKERNYQCTARAAEREETEGT